MNNVKISNYYYLTAGLLALLFALTHAWNGHAAALPALDHAAVSLDSRIIFTYVWHIITAENAIFGVAFLFMSMRGEHDLTSLAASLIVSILLVRLTVILGVTALYDASALADTILDSVAIVIYVALIVLGMRVKHKQRLSV